MKKLILIFLLLVLGTSCKQEEIVASKEYSCGMQLTTLMLPVGNHKTIIKDSLTITEVNSILKKQEYDYILIGCNRTK